MTLTAPEYIKKQGLPSLVWVADKVGKDKRTIYKWYETNFPLFETLVKGCVMSQDHVKGVWHREDKDLYLVVDTRARCYTGVEIHTDKDKMGIVRKGLLYDREKIE